MVFVELLWLRLFLSEIGYPSSGTMNFYCDSKIAREIVNNSIQHDPTYHDELDCHFIKKKIDTKIVTLPFVKSEAQLQIF
jgi:hypothetical protein